MEKSRQIERLLWSIAFPGFGQILNGQLLKGFLFIAMEFFVNVQSRLNDVILSSFHGLTAEAISGTRYQWLMFYPCIYMFAMWDAYKAAGNNQKPYSVLPFVFGAYSGTIGVIFSKNRIGFLLPGPVWMGIAGLMIGLAVGCILQKILIRKQTS